MRTYKFHVLFNFRFSEYYFLISIFNSQFINHGRFKSILKYPPPRSGLPSDTRTYHRFQPGGTDAEQSRPQAPSLTLYGMRCTFCHWACPLGNKQPEFQDALCKGKWREAYQVLNETNDFPEFTGRICPALCEKSCVLKLSCDAPVTIRENEAAIAEAAFREGYIVPVRPERNGWK